LNFNWNFLLKFIARKDTSWESFCHLYSLACTFYSSWFAPGAFINSITWCLISICACIILS
jgi:hypothetical protein